jgi:hypothetical protein
MLKQLPNQTTYWTEHQRRCIGLKRVTLNSPFMIYNKSPCVLNKLSELILVLRLLLALVSR